MSLSCRQFPMRTPSRSIQVAGRRHGLTCGSFPNPTSNRSRERCTMILNQFYLPCLAHASYLIGDEQTGTAAVVDPQRDTDQYIGFAAERGLKIEHVFLSHLHADFVAGHLELRQRAGATIYLG